MTNTANRRRRERATSTRADSILEHLEGLPYGLEHRRQLVGLDAAYEQLRELLAVGEGHVDRWRGLFRHHEPLTAATVDALLEAAHPPQGPSELSISYAPGAHPDPVRRAFDADPDPSFEAWLRSPRGQQVVDRLALLNAWSPDHAAHLLRTVARRSSP